MSGLPREGTAVIRYTYINAMQVLQHQNRGKSLLLGTKINSVVLYIVLSIGFKYW